MANDKARKRASAEADARVVVSDLPKTTGSNPRPLGVHVVAFYFCTFCWIQLMSMSASWRLLLSIINIWLLP